MSAASNTVFTVSKSKGLFTCSILSSIAIILVSIVVILTSIEPILEKCVHLQVASIITILVTFEAILIYIKAFGRPLL